MPGETGFPGGVALKGNIPLIAPGKAASQNLRIASDVVQDTTVTIGSDVYRVAGAATDSTKNISGLATTTPANNPYAVIDMASHGLKVRDIIRVENEIMLVDYVLNAHQIRVRRACFGTALATHADGLDIFTEAALGAGSIPVGLNATLTPTAFTPALVWAINNLGREKIKAYQHSVNRISVVACDKPAKDGGVPIAGVNTMAVAETLAGANNAWDAANLAGGRAPSGMDVISYVPTAADVALGAIVMYFPYTPIVEMIIVVTTSTGAAVVWDGVATVSGNQLTIDNAGSTDWATTSTLRIFVRGS